MSGALMNGMSAPTQRALWPSFHPVRIQQKVSNLQPRRGPELDTESADTVIFDFQNPELREINFCCL